MQTETAAEPVRLQSRVRRLQGRAIGFATVIACAAVLAGACVFYAGCAGEGPVHGDTQQQVAERGGAVAPGGAA